MNRPAWPIRAFLKIWDFCLYRNNRNTNDADAGGEVPPSEVFFDRACPLCRAEMMRLKQFDRADRLRLVDITAADYDPSTWGVSREAAAAALHVLTPERIWLVGMPAIRHVYAQAGLGWLMAPTGWPLVEAVADRAYRWLAPNRMAVSRWLGLGRADPCTDESCAVQQQRKGG